jgi:hypothetical protein
VKIFGITLALAAAIVNPIGSSVVQAQAMSGRQIPDRPVISVSYYKTPPGMQDEWLALYIKWHRPIMDYQIQQGVTLSSTVYANSGHAIEPSWDFMIINTSPPPNQAKKLNLTRGQVIQRLFPDLAAYYEGEKSRWRMTLSHWDQTAMEVDLNALHPGVYYPILPDGR